MKWEPKDPNLNKKKKDRKDAQVAMARRAINRYFEIMMGWEGRGSILWLREAVRIWQEKPAEHLASLEKQVAEEAGWAFHYDWDARHLINAKAISNRAAEELPKMLKEKETEHAKKEAEWARRERSRINTLKQSIRGFED